MKLILILAGTHIIDHYNPLVRIIDLFSNTTYVVCVNSIYKWRDLQFKVDSKRQIFWETFSWQVLFTLKSSWQKWGKWEEIAKEILFLFCLAWGSNPGFTSNKPTHYLLDLRRLKIMVHKDKVHSKSFGKYKLVWLMIEWFNGLSNIKCKGSKFMWSINISKEFILKLNSSGLIRFNWRSAKLSAIVHHAFTKRISNPASLKDHSNNR